VKILHPNLHRLKAFTDDELPGAVRGRVAAHLARCTECRKILGSIRELREVVREATASPVPEDTWSRILARRAAGEQLILPVPGAAIPPCPRTASSAIVPRVLRRAAVLVLGAAGVASATVPGSPVREWLGSVWQRDRAVTVSAPPSPAPPSESMPPDLPIAGMSVLPVDGEVQIRVEAPDPEVRIRVRLSDGDQVDVQASGAAAGSLFRTGPGRIAVVEAGPGEVRINIPRSTRKATLLVDGTLYLLKEGEQVRILATAADTMGTEFILGVHR
jgi:anti-sigma factor RsiW